MKSEKEILLCSICGVQVSADAEMNENHNNDPLYICDSCYNDHSWCNRCGKYHNDSEYRDCDWCDERIAPCEDTHEDSANTFLCDRCCNNAYICAECSRYLRTDDVYEYSGDDLCHECYDSFSDDDSDMLHCHSYQPLLIYHGSGHWYMGIELEVDNGVNRNQCIGRILSAANMDADHLYIKEDGSLNNGFEMVSMPATLQYHLTCFPWEKIMTIAKDYSFRSYDTSTCGLHVHVGRIAFGEAIYEQEFAIAKLMYIMESNWSQLARFSRRTSEELEEWAWRYSVEASCGAVDTLYLKARKDNDCCRYYALNLQNHNTVEFRLFKGTLNYSTFVASLQMVSLLIDTASSLNLDQVKTVTWQQLVENGQQYPQLQEYLQHRGLR